VFIRGLARGSKKERTANPRTGTKTDVVIGGVSGKQQEHVDHRERARTLGRGVRRESMRRTGGKNDHR